jgi:hypothetical protein
MEEKHCRNDQSEYTNVSDRCAFESVRQGFEIWDRIINRWLHQIFGLSYHSLAAPICAPFWISSMCLS